MYLAADDPNREEVLKAAKEIMTVMLSSYFIGAIDEALSGFLRGLGETLLPMIASIGGICAFRLLWINLIYPYLGTLTWMYMVYPISWTITGLGLAFMSVIAWKKRVRPMMAELQKTEK